MSEPFSVVMLPSFSTKTPFGLSNDNSTGGGVLLSHSNFSSLQLVHVNREAVSTILAINLTVVPFFFIICLMFICNKAGSLIIRDPVCY